MAGTASCSPARAPPCWCWQRLGQWPDDKIRVMPDVLIYGDTLRDAGMRHEIPLVVPDPFLYAEIGGVRHVVVASLERARVASLNSGLTIHTPEEFGYDQLLLGGSARAEA